MPTPLSPPEVQAGFAVDLAQLEHFLSEVTAPVVAAFIEAPTSEDNPWCDLIAGAYSRLVIMLALAQLGEVIPSVVGIGGQIDADAETRLQELLVQAVQ